MAENLRNDPFEKFLKKSLAEHEEPAPADMWPRIEEHLPTGPADGTRPALPRAAWWAVAAILCAALVAWQFVRYEHRIGQLEQALRRQQDSIALLHEQWHALQRTETQTRPRYEVTPAGAAGQAHCLPANEAPTASPEFFTASHRATGEPAATQKSETDLPTPEPHPSAPTPHERSPLRGAAQNASAPHAATARLPMQGTAVAHPALVPIQSLTIRQWQPEGVLPARPLPPLRAPRNGQALAAEWMQLQTTRRTVAFKNRPFFGGKEFYDSTRLHLSETMAGLTWERPLAKRWQLRTGLHLRLQAYELAHQARFKYGESMPWGPPYHGGGPYGHGPHYEQVFAYNLNTATGVLSLRLAVVPQDTLQPVSPDEQITMNVRLRQRTSYLAIPIGVQYRQPLGRLSLACTGGLMANLLLHDEAALLDVQSLHPFFEPDKQAFDLKMPYARDLYLEGMASIRLEYPLTRHWRIGAGPTFVGLLTSPHKAWYIQTKGWSVGWAASVQRLF